MKPIGIFGMAAIFLLAASPAALQARQEKQEKQEERAKPERHQARPEKQAQAGRQKDQRQEHSAKHQQQARQQAGRRQEQQHNRSAQQRTSDRKHQQQAAWQGGRARNWQSEHRTWQQRGGYKGYHIPNDRFHGRYGQDHGFRFHNLPVRYVSGHRRFNYGGYWFGLVDPWPEYWSSDWYDSDDVYVDYYNDGYYLYNRRHPSDRIAISFYLN